MNLKVPYLAEEAIERDAEALLAEFSRARNVIVRLPIPIEDIIEKHLKLRIEFDDMHRLLEIPRDVHCRDRGPDILGAIIIPDRRIIIDESLDPEENPSMEGRYRFTYAHEGCGHWRLHRHLFDELEDPKIVCQSSQAKMRVEWQADFYASCVLMPRRFVFDAWRKEFGTWEPFIFDAARHLRPRSKGPRRLDAIVRGILEPHAHAFDRIAEKFAPMFGVSRAAMRIRLEKLGLLQGEIFQLSNLAS